MENSIYIKPAVLTPIKASNYLGIDTEKDALKSSRSTGVLWGLKAPKFIKAGKKKIIYPVINLDEFLAQFQEYTNTAQIIDGGASND